MMFVFLSGPCVYICFNYYVRNVPDGKVFHRMIVSVISRMNQIRLVFRGEPRFQPYRWPCRAGHRAPGAPFAAGKRDNCRHAATCGLSAETYERRAIRRGALLKFETPVRRSVRPAWARRIRPSNHGIASHCSTIAAARPRLSRYIPETKNAVPGAMVRPGGRMPRATPGGISHGMRFARLNAPASGRHDATTMWGRPVRHKPVGEAAMNTISSGLIRAFLAHHRGSRNDRGRASDAVPASWGAPCRFPALRARRVLERLPFRAATRRQRCSTSFSVPGWGRLFVPDSVAPISLQPCRAVSIAPGRRRRRPD